MVAGEMVLLPHAASNSVLVCEVSKGASKHLCDLYTDGTEEPKRMTSMEQLLATDVINESTRVCVSCSGYKCMQQE